MSDNLKLVLVYRIQGDGFLRKDLLRNYILRSIPTVIFRSDLEPDLISEHYRKTGITTEKPPGFDDYIVNVSVTVVHE